MTTQPSVRAPNDTFFKMCLSHFLIFEEIFSQTPHIENLKRVIMNRCVGDFLNWYDPQNPCAAHRLELLEFMMIVLLRKNCGWLMTKINY